MIVMIICCGLGNQMFQYACAYATAKDRGDDFRLDVSRYNKDIREYQLNQFNIKENIIDFKQDTSGHSGRFHRFLQRLVHLHKIDGIMHTKFINELNHMYYTYCPERLEYKRSAYIYGFWQNSAYFSKYRDELVEQFRLKDEFIGDDFRLLEHEILRAENTVSVHIRRGDYVSLGLTLPDQYYIEALSFF